MSAPSPIAASHLWFRRSVTSSGIDTIAKSATIHRLARAMERVSLCRNQFMSRAAVATNDSAKAIAAT